MRQKTIKRKIKKFSFWNSICFSHFICDKNKRNFIKLISPVIYKKLSIEYFLKISNNFEMLKEFVLNEDEIKNFNELPPMNLDKQIKLFEISNT